MQERWGCVASGTALGLHKDGGKGNGKCQEPKSRVLRFRPPALAMCFQVDWDAAGTKSRRGLGGKGVCHSFPGRCCAQRPQRLTPSYPMTDTVQFCPVSCWSSPGAGRAVYGFYPAMDWVAAEGTLTLTLASKLQLRPRGESGL